MAELLPTPQQYAELLAAMQELVGNSSCAAEGGTAGAGWAAAGGSSSNVGASMGSDAVEGAAAPLVRPAYLEQDPRRQNQGERQEWGQRRGKAGAEGSWQRVDAQQHTGAASYPEGAQQQQQACTQPRGSAAAAGSEWEQQALDGLGLGGLATHPNSQSARPAKRLPAAKRARIAGTAGAACKSAAPREGEPHLCPPCGVLLVRL